MQHLLANSLHGRHSALQSATEHLQCQELGLLHSLHLVDQCLMAMMAFLSQICLDVSALITVHHTTYQYPHWPP